MSPLKGNVIYLNEVEYKHYETEKMGPYYLGSDRLFHIYYFSKTPWYKVGQIGAINFKIISKKGKLMVDSGVLSSDASTLSAYSLSESDLLHIFYDKENDHIDIKFYKNTAGFDITGAKLIVNVFSAPVQIYP